MLSGGICHANPCPTFALSMMCCEVEAGDDIDVAVRNVFTAYPTISVQLSEWAFK